MRSPQSITPLVALAITVALVGIAGERSRDFDNVISFLALFGTTVAIFAVLSLGLNVQWGYTGVFNFGVVAFFMMGAYTAAVFTKPPSESQFVQYVGGFGDALDFLPVLDSEQWLPFLVAIPAAGLTSGILAFLLSIPTLRLREDYLAITTIGVAEVLRRVTIEERGLVNGTRGLVGIPQPFRELVEADEYKFLYFGIAVVVLILLYVAVERGIRSPWGRVLRALREDEVATAASGKNVFAFKSQGFVLGAVIMGMGGAVFAFQQRSVSPDTFTHFFGTFLFWAMLIVGGSGNNKGAVLGAYVVWGFWQLTLLIQSYTPEDPGPLGLSLPTAVQSRMAFIRDFTLGSLIVLVLLVRPQGLLPEERRVSIWVERQVRRFRPTAAAAGAGPPKADPPRK